MSTVIASFMMLAGVSSSEEISSRPTARAQVTAQIISGESLRLNADTFDRRLWLKPKDGMVYNLPLARSRANVESADRQEILLMEFH